MHPILTMFAARARAPTRGVSGSRFVRSDAHQLLAEIGALEKPDECHGRAVEAFGNEIAMLDFPLAHPLRHVAQKIRMTSGEIADNEAADGQPFGQYIPHQR